MEPSDSAEAKEFMKYAYDLSEKYDTPVILRSTTRLSHSQGLVELEERAEPFDIPYERDMAKYVMMPGNAIKRHVVVEARMKQMAEDANSLPINRVEYNDLSVGFITNGIAYQYVKEAMPQASVLKLGLLNPLPRKLSRNLRPRWISFTYLRSWSRWWRNRLNPGAFRRQWARKYSRFRVNTAQTDQGACAGPDITGG